jgi:hypothetical protein
MRLHLLITVLLTFVVLWPAVAHAQQPEGSTELAANAALQYWKAIALMPTLDKEQEKIVEEANSIKFDAAAVKLIEASQSSLMLLRRGAELKRCDWGLDYNDGMGLLLPYLAKARELARLAALDARHDFEQGNWKGGRADATAIMALGRHAGRDPIMICVLVRYLIEGIVIDLVAPYVPEMKASHSQAVAMFEAMPPAANVLATISTEKKYMCEWMIRKLKEEEQRKAGAGRELFVKLLDGSEVPESLKQIKSAEEGIKLAESLLPVYDELAQLVALPKAEFDTKFPEFKARIKAANPLAGALLPAVDRLLAKEHRHQARMAMLLAGIAVAEGGEAKLKEIKDPFGTGPFGYRLLEKGFELKSKLVYEGQPVTLVIGQRK